MNRRQSIKSSPQQRLKPPRIQPDILEPTPAITTPKRPPSAEVMTVWKSCVGVTEDTEAVQLLESWSTEPAAVYIEDLARVLPLNGPHFPWMIARGQPWHQGWRLIVPALGVTGEIESLKARWIREKDPPGQLKSASPKGCQIGQLVTANGAAEIILRTEQLPLNCSKEARFDVWIVEGEKDLIIQTSRHNNSSHDAKAVFGIWSGGWTTQIAQRLPMEQRIRIIIATDPDEAGNKYAKDIYKTLITRGFRRTQLARWEG